jgi:hypothetical protein
MNIKEATNKLAKVLENSGSVSRQKSAETRRLLVQILMDSTLEEDGKVSKIQYDQAYETFLRQNVSVVGSNVRTKIKHTSPEDESLISYCHPLGSTVTERPENTVIRYE